jgi:hypothetical protein
MMHFAYDSAVRTTILRPKSVGRFFRHLAGRLAEDGLKAPVAANPPVGRDDAVDRLADSVLSIAALPNSRRWQTSMSGANRLQGASTAPQTIS